MKKVHVVRLTDEEKQAIRNDYDALKKAVFSLNQFESMEQYVKAEHERLKRVVDDAQAQIEKLDNQSVLVLRKVYEVFAKQFEGIDEMADFSDIIRKIRDAKGEKVELEDSHVKLVRKVFQKAVDEKLIETNLEKFITIYKTFQD